MKTSLVRAGERDAYHLRLEGRSQLRHRGERRGQQRCCLVLHGPKPAAANIKNYAAFWKGVEAT